MSEKRRKMTLNQAIQILMDCASRDVRGSGLGIRSTTDEWRAKVAVAWSIAFKRVYGWEPSTSDYLNAGMHHRP